MASKKARAIGRTVAHIARMKRLRISAKNVATRPPIAHRVAFPSGGVRGSD